MSEIAIRIENLGKQYRIGAPKPGDRSFREMGTGIFTFPEHKLATIKNRLRSSNGDGKVEPFDHIWALRDVSFDVKRGEVVGIIGGNGAGKSTLLKILSRITKPTKGSARIYGRVRSLLEVGTGFHPELTGRENIFLSGAILGMTKAEMARKFDEIMDFSGIEKFIDTPVKRYSSGMQVRLGFAVAAHLEPEILLVDEVLAVGDAAFQNKCLGKIGEVANRGRTVLFVSHNMSTVKSLTSRCIYLGLGSVLGMGPTSEVIEQYLETTAQESTADFSTAQRHSEAHGEAIRIRRIRPVVPGNAGFNFGDDLSFEVELSSKVTRANLRFGATVADFAGAPVLTTITPKDIAVEADTRISCVLRIVDCRLVPGTYALSISIGEGGQDEARTNYDVVNPGPSFSISPISLNGSEVFQWDRSYGAIVHTHSRITHSRTLDHARKLADFLPE